jgi:hypothetical protein
MVIRPRRAPARGLFIFLTIGFSLDCRPGKGNLILSLRRGSGEGNQPSAWSSWLGKATSPSPSGRGQGERN